MPYLFTQETAQPTHPIGGKARALSILGQAGGPVPYWLAITPDAFFDSLSPAQAKAMHALESPVETLVEGFPFLEQFQLKPEIREQIEAALVKAFPAGQLVAVRSSALDEDGATASFAGQLQTFLFVPATQVLDKVIAVWRSGFSAQVIAYRVSKGLPPLPSVPAVIVQQMVDATTSGVAFGADPVTGDVDVAVISSLYGLGTALVSGECDADVYHLHTKHGETFRHIAHKAMAARCSPNSPEGVALMPVSSAMADQPSLTDSQLALVAQWVSYCTLTLGAAQDVEWAFVGSQFYILQSRPITTPLQGDPSPYYYYWNDDHMDSWLGVTTPLTFSFTRRFYESKFHHLARSFGVSPAKIKQNQAVFRRMSGLVRGRIYFNTSALEEVWATVPGFCRYRHIFNDWMDISDLPSGSQPPPMTLLALVVEHLLIARTLLGLGWVYLHWGQAMASFNTEINQILSLTAIDLGRMNMDRLLLLFHRLEGALTRQWGKPTINNFFANFFYSQLAKRTRDWCEDQDMSLRNNLLCGEGDISSTRPVKMLEILAWLVVESPGLMDCLCQQSLAEIEAAIPMAPAFYYQYRRYLQEYGQRCHESSLLESPNIADNPLQLLRSIGFFARRLKTSGQLKPALNIDEPSAFEQEIRRDAEAVVERHLSGHPIRRLIFNFVLSQARGRVKDRENIRYVQTQVLGRFRQVLLQLGRCFQELNLLDHPRDIFYLELEEVIGFVEGTVTCRNLKGLVALRKVEFDDYLIMEPPPSCFESRSSICLDHITEIYTEDGIISVDDDGLPSETQGQMVFVGEDELAGFGCSPGLIRGPVAFVGGNSNRELKGGEILVAELGDPGLVMLFSAAGGLLFEKGSPLSHLSIVAREMGIPTIVSVGGLKAWLQEGDWVEMDGKTGLVRRIEKPLEAI